MKMNTEGENTAENQDSKFTSPSPSTQSEISADGDNCSGQSLPSDSDKAQTTTTVNNVSHSEPKAKKRRKQSNPIKCPNVLTSSLQPPIDDVDLNEGENEIVKRFKEDDEAHHQVEVKPSLHNETKKADTASSQQTSTLHSVTSALYNNKMREIEKSHAVTVSAKESSLQSSTDVSSPDSNDGVVQNSELKISLASMFPQMPPLLPLNSVDLTGDVSKISNVFSPFSEVSLPHPPSSLSLVQSSRNFTNSSGMRIFNPEAYCELCEKEFCNKYFLKTHKANKHGITTVDSPSSFAYRTSFKGMPLTSPGNHLLTNQVIIENGSGSNFADNYCNICQKTFCNKYFLKKHRLNIHGISDGENLGTLPNSIHVPVISSTLPPSRFHSAEVKSEDNSVDMPTSDNSALKSSNLDVKPSSFSSSNSGIVTSNSNCSTDFSVESKSKALVLNLHVSDSKNEKYLCELCNIEFTDRRYLESHRKNRHGAEVVVKVESKSPDLVEGVASGKSSPDQENRDAFREQTCTPCMKTFTSADTFQAHMFETHGRVKDEDKANDVNHKVNQSQESKLVDNHLSNLQSGKKLPYNQENESSNSSSDSGMFSCNICSAKCKDRSSLNIHLESEHSLHEKFASRISTMFGIGDMSMFMGSHDSPISCGICQENFPDRNQLRSHMLRCHSVFSPNMDAPSEAADSDSLRKLDGEFYTYDRQKSVGGRNYCIICNKELCNKYFMKTHMWKMHGIDVDKLTVSGKTASTAGGVFCNICQKVLCSKYFLKVHKQNVHGIFEDVPRTPAAFSTLLGGEASQKDINDEKASEVSVPKQNQSNIVNNNQFNVSDELVGNAQRSSGFCCEICGEEFPSKIFLQIHLVNKHVNNNESKGTNLGKVLGLPSGSPQLLTVNAGLLSPHAIEQLNELRKEIPRCSCCMYLGKEAPVTSISEKQPSQVNSNEENKFHCHICNVSYEFADYLKHHKNHLNQTLALQSDGESGQIVSPLSDLKTRNKMRPRKFKRFRCSKCDKKFRTKEKCLHHIQVTHKSKKGINQSANDVQAYDSSLGLQKEMSSDKVDLQRSISKDANVSYEKDVTESSLKDSKRSSNHSVLYQSPSLPVPYVMPENSPTVIMQPFHLSEPKTEGVPKQDVFVPSLVYLPVNQKVSEPITVAFTLTPA